MEYSNDSSTQTVSGVVAFFSTRHRQALGDYQSGHLEFTYTHLVLLRRAFHRSRKLQSFSSSFWG